MWSDGARRDRLGVALDIDDPEFADALAEALARHPALALAAPDEAAAVTVSDRGAPDEAVGGRRLGLDALPEGADADLVLAAAHVVAAGLVLTRPAAGAEGPAGPRLGPRAREVLELLVDGASNKVIARSLGISPHTAKFHVAGVLRELGARNRAEAVRLALREGLVML